MSDPMEQLEDGAAAGESRRAVEGNRQDLSVRQKEVEGVQPEAEDDEELAGARGQALGFPRKEEEPSAFGAAELGHGDAQKSRKAARRAPRVQEYEEQQDESSYGPHGEDSIGLGVYGSAQADARRRNDHPEAANDADYEDAAVEERRESPEGEDPAQRRKHGRAKKRGTRRREVVEEAAYPEDVVHDDAQANDGLDEEGMFMDESAFEKTSSRYTSSVDAKQQISGCLFGCLGLIVLGFAVWLIHAGRASQRQEEIVAYVKAVKAWKDMYRSQFEQLSFALHSANSSGVETAVPLVTGNETAEWDIRHALGRTKGEKNLLRKERYEDRLENDFYYRAKGSGSRRRLEEISELSDDELAIDYMPLKYELNFTPTSETAFFPTIYELDHKKHFASLNFTFSDGRPNGVKDQLLQSPEIRLLHKEEKFSKNFEFCKKGNGRRIGAHTCLHFFIPTKICLVADYLPKTAATNTTNKGNEGHLAADDEYAWQFQTKPCALQYLQRVPDSREYFQEVAFHDYPMTVEIRSAKDPHFIFGQLTKGKFILDDSADSQIAAGSILLIFAILMLAMSAYKTYRFCVKYTCRSYLQRRKMMKYLESNQLDPDDLAEIGDSRGARPAAKYH